MKKFRFLKTQTRRNWDRGGGGFYGAPRSGSGHKGVDILCGKGDCVLMPFDGFVKRKGYPYRGDKKYQLVEVIGERYEDDGLLHNYRIKIMYVSPFSGRGRHAKGEHIAETQTISKRYPHLTKGKNPMQDHVHIEVYKNGMLTDPEPLIEWD